MLLELWNRAPFVFVHMVAALAALLLGGFLLTRRKGDAGHRTLGWTWVVLMATVVVSSAFIRDYRMPNVAGITPIHFFTLLTAISLPSAVLAARRGDIALHRKSMRALYMGACVVAGVFTLVPGRYLGTLVWHHWLGIA